ncbi:LON peptidase substrate-binding domain-containing protein [Aliiroseovarius sp. YM-037]|uniref:LON peptidase substrate-binding domain-containing protein n=1 Tax=Aliiroseovarius sp. YM-037 TaxID=3341728 RepID=UPI003A806EB6
MFSAADLPDTLPLFPLPGAMVLPRARLPLHIFEPRYLAMFEDALKTTHRFIGMIQPVADDDNPRLHTIGCAGRVSAFTETDDGRYMITLTGISRFRLGKVHEGFTPYMRADVRWQGFDGDLKRAQHDSGFDRAGFLSLLRRYLEAEELSADWENMKEAEDELLINSLSMLCPFDIEDKQALLEASSLSTRRETLVTLMEYALRRGHSDETIQ